jgi:D-alanyl-D-alanine carboxypeptidase/D-alanyl-D-alanine-endopeptidase (penicillin-binding protein 4)
MRKWIRGWRTTEDGKTERRKDGRVRARACVRPARKGVIVLSLIAVSVLPSFRPSVHAQSARRLDALLDAEPFRHSIWGVAVVDERGRLLYGRNADRMMIPASNTKLVVTAVAAALLPPDFTVNTSLYGTGPVVDGVLRGDLVLYGRGDPAFGVRCYAIDTMATGACERDPATPLRKLVEGLRAKGIRSVDGALIGDGSYFEATIVHPAWDYFDTFWWYAAPISGLTFNDNSVDIKWGPGPSVGAPAVFSIAPAYHGFTFENRTRTVESEGETDIGDRIWRHPGTHDAWAEGTVALGHRGGTDYFAVPDPNLFAARALRSLLADAGIAVTGETRSTTDSLAYAHARATPPIAEVASRPLRDWIFPILNTSQNLYAEVLLKQLGKQFGSSGSWREGIRVERRFLIDSVKVDSAQFAVFDGSGLAAENLVSPVAFTQILRFMRNHPRFSTFIAGMPQSGKRGSLRTRFIGTPLEGRVMAKTGSISRVNTLSGYIDAPGGRRLTFSIQANHHTAGGRAALARIDSIVVEMARR